MRLAHAPLVALLVVGACDQEYQIDESYVFYEPYSCNQTSLDVSQWRMQLHEFVPTPDYQSEFDDKDGVQEPYLIVGEDRFDFEVGAHNKSHYFPMGQVTVDFELEESRRFEFWDHDGIREGFRDDRLGSQNVGVECLDGELNVFAGLASTPIGEEEIIRILVDNSIVFVSVKPIR